MFKRNPTDNQPDNQQNKNANGQAASNNTDPYGLMHPLGTSLVDNVNRIKDILKYDQSVVYRNIENMYLKPFKACILFIDGMANLEDINDNIVTPVMQTDLKEFVYDNILDRLMNTVICTGDIIKSGNLDELLQSLFKGDILLFVEGYAEALIMPGKGWMLRAITEPEFEKVMEGPREGFNEYLIVNISLIRRRVKSPDLRFKFKELGVRSQTKLCLCYMETLVNDKVLRELESRLDKIDVDAIIGANFVAESIMDSPLSVFVTVGSTERPDVVERKILEGRIAIIVDGSPKVLTVPFVFMEYFQSADDYHTEFYFASINRFLRILSAIITVAAPAIFLAMVTYHQEMIPTPLLLSISSARQGVPFPTALELLLLILSFDLVREASSRIPSAIGQSISIVGALVLGQAAVQAKFFSALVVIIAALTGITGLLVPKIKGAFIIIRTALLFLAAFMGLYGFIFGFIVLFMHMFSIRSLGVPYTMGLGSIKADEISDTYIRAPWWYLNYRPRLISSKDVLRQSLSSRKGKIK